MEDSNYEIILETAAKKFRQYGIHSLSMNDLSKFCGVSKKTIYKYFQNKSDLIESIMDKKIDLLKNDLKELHSVSVNSVSELNCFFNLINELVNSLSPTIYRDLKRYHLNLFVKYDRVKNDVYKPFALENIKNGKVEGFYKDDLNDAEISNSIIDVIDMLFEEGIRKDKASIKTVDFFENMIIHKMVTLKGLKELNTLLEV